MVDSGAVGGLAPLGDRYDGSGQPHDRAPAHPHEARSQGRDVAEVAAGVEAAFALLRERVLAATRRRTVGPPPAGTILGSGLVPGHALCPFGQSRAPCADAAAAVVAIENEQRWQAAGQLDAASLRCAFDDGLDETEAILRDVAPDGESAPWLAAVRRALAARASCGP